MTFLPNDVFIYNTLVQHSYLFVIFIPKIKKQYVRFVVIYLSVSERALRLSNAMRLYTDEKSTVRRKKE